MSSEHSAASSSAAASSSTSASPAHFSPAEDKIIHVPQGRGARLTRETSKLLGISGLYTDGFSTCCIIVCIGENKRLLIHADHMNDPQKIREEVEWIGQNSEIFFIYRSELYTQIADRIFQALQVLSQNEVRRQEVSADQKNIYVPFEAQDAGLHPFIQITEQPSHNLLRHPQEQKFTAVQKIEQLIRLEEHGDKRTAYNDKKICIFDEKYWEPIPASDCTIDISYPSTRIAMGNFNKSQNQLHIVRELAAITENLHRKGVQVNYGGDLIGNYIAIARELEGYLNDFDELKLLKFNISEFLKRRSPDSIFSRMPPETQQDHKIIGELSKLKSRQGKEYIAELIISYKQQAPDSKCKKYFLEICETFLKDYDKRYVYTLMKVEYETYVKQAERYEERAKQHFGKSEFEAAANLFLDALRMRTRACLRNDPMLASAYYNYGRALQRIGDTLNALSYFEISADLRENYTDPRPSEDDIQKPRRAIGECQAAEAAKNARSM